jgi:seryl-tRNA synthetase
LSTNPSPSAIPRYTFRLLALTLQDDNQLLKRWSPNAQIPLEHTDILSHHEVLYRIGGYDQEPRGVKVVGHRGYFLTGYGVRLNFALVQYGLDFLTKREYTPIQTPFFMNKDVMAKTAQLDDFDDQLYKVPFLRRAADTGYGRDR